jgi:hypothetical protein
MICPQISAMEQRIEGLKKFLSTLLSLQTPIYLIATLEYKLSMTLQIPFDPQYVHTCPIPTDTHLMLITAIRHQNLLGWDLFLRGFTSNYWNTVFTMAHCNSTSPKTIQQWDQKLVEEALNLYQSIWTTQNIVLHGTTKLEAKEKLRERVFEQVRDVYKNPTQTIQKNKFNPLAASSQI